MAGYPILLDLGGRRVVVVGGGRIAERRVADLVQAGADVVVVAPQVGSGLHAWAASGAVRVTPRSYEPGDLAGAWLVMAATDDADTNARVGADAAAAGVFCVRVDDAATGSARVPAVARSGAFTVAVNAGDDPRRAAALRQAIAVALDTGTLSA
nr:uroporphyrinogen-III C-methyltransferase [Actinomycetota bacterium]